MSYQEAYYAGRANFRAAIKYDVKVSVIYNRELNKTDRNATDIVNEMRRSTLNNLKINGSLEQVGLLGRVDHQWRSQGC